MSTTKTPETKRRRVSVYDNVQPALIKSLPSSPAASEEDRQNSGLKEIPRLFFELPKDNISDVCNAVYRLRILFKREGSPQDWEGNRKEAINVGMTGMLVLLLRKWNSQGGPRAQDILSKTMACLASLAKDDATSIVKLGGVNLIVAALKRFPYHVTLQCNGLLALCKILSVDRRDPLPIREETDRFVTHMDGINLVVTAMKRSPEKTNLQYNGCFVLDTIAQVATHHQTLHNSGATSVAAAAVRNHFDNAAIKKCPSLCLFVSHMFPTIAHKY